MWSWIKSLLFKEIVYGVIDSSLQKKNWLGFTLLEVTNDNSGFLVSLDYDELEIGIGNTARVWRMPFNTNSRAKEFAVDIFGTGIISYFTSGNLVFLYTVFWKVIYLKDEFFINGNDVEYDIKKRNIVERLKFFDNKKTVGFIDVISRDDAQTITEYKVSLVYTNTIWGRGSSVFTKSLMNLISKDIVVSRIHMDIEDYNTVVIGVNTDKKLKFLEALKMVVSNNSDRISKISLSNAVIENIDDSTYIVCM